MRVLLDTDSLIWLVTDDPTLSALAKSVFLDGGNALFVSAVVGLEIAFSRSSDPWLVLTLERRYLLPAGAWDPEKLLVAWTVVSIAAVLANWTTTENETRWYDSHAAGTGVFGKKDCRYIFCADHPYGATRTSSRTVT